MEDPRELPEALVVTVDAVIVHQLFDGVVVVSAEHLHGTGAFIPPECGAEDDGQPSSPSRVTARGAPPDSVAFNAAGPARLMPDHLKGAKQTKRIFLTSFVAREAAEVY